MKKNSENAVDTKQNADGTEQKNKREKGALVRLTYVASGSVVKRSLSLFTAFHMNNEEKKKRKHGRLVEQIADGTKQNKKRQKVYAVPRGSQFCKSGLGILRKGEVIP
ncbi:hypothetical protein T05_15454 [Trichinella murrelli]|uniref:Uncharacterized protein n=1 Tax=Trichinella murrelli TaxID=144512 RepID=A0A0V0T7Z5_9BILA|nr:hypothetical protein T05_15454 [Trichinella murrelli]